MGSSFLFIAIFAVITYTGSRNLVSHTSNTMYMHARTSMVVSHLIVEKFRGQAQVSGGAPA